MPLPLPYCCREESSDPHDVDSMESDDSHRDFPRYGITLNPTIPGPSTILSQSKPASTSKSCHTPFTHNRSIWSQVSHTPSSHIKYITSPVSNTNSCYKSTSQHSPINIKGSHNTVLLQNNSFGNTTCQIGME
ncbi:hypothetical protein Pmani_008821 [Petrolisthes manimaculis]|uniref:Uncharacterized protein n=1 Tax=Petrolisthes manimaculis TaxID=1843537 RepID=A0AAE1UIJ6_9EUCA|nr:hypothetical protein Pmani_008821 [Petrolisthes manimaculis]